MTYYLKNGSTYRVATPESLDLHETLPAGNYILKADSFGNIFLECIDPFELPSRIYGDTEKTAERILNTFDQRGLNTGVLLTGEKGSGKTLLSKMLSVRAAQQGMPTIVINHPWSGDQFNKLIQDIDQPCIVLFDEFEKVYDSERQESILTLLDGVFTSKKLFVLTCNDRWRIDQHMRNRPGRIYYCLDYKGLEADFVREYCEENLRDTSHVDGVVDVSGLFPQFNFDMLKAMVEEMNRYGETPQEALRFLNAKPEFMDGDVYSVEAIVRNQTVDTDDISPNEWRGNPLRGDLDFEVKGKWIEDGDEDDWYSLEIAPRDLKKVDGKDGKFVFSNKDGTIILTRRKSKVVDYFGAL